MNTLSVISAFVIVLLSTFFSLAQAKPEPSEFHVLVAQQLERLILKKGDEKAPVKISGVRAKGRRVDANKPFVDEDDWLKGLTFELANASGKTVTFILVQMVFPHPERTRKQPGAAVFIEYGDNPFNHKTAEAMPPLRVKPVLPGDFLELPLGDERYATIRPLLEAAKITVNNKVEVRVSAIGFSDGTAWSSGQMVQRSPEGSWMPLR